MKKQIISVLVFGLTFMQSHPVFPKDAKTLAVQTLDNSITATVYDFKKTKYYTAVEIGFNNPTSDYLEFTPKEIYLDDEIKYSLTPLTTEEVSSIAQKNPGIGIVPGALALGLGVASLGTAIGGKGDAAKGLGIAALSMGGAYAVTKGIENHTERHRLITFENNSLDSIKRLPPGMTLGGTLYFPSTKKPKSITLISRSQNGGYEKKVFGLNKK